MGPRVLRRPPDDLAELRFRPGRVAELKQRGTEPMAERRVPRVEREAATEIVGGRGPLAFVERLATPHVVGLQALEQRVELPHQRVDRERVDLALTRARCACACSRSPSPR